MIIFFHWFVLVFINFEGLDMARNEEKHYSKLNRIILQREKEEYEKKHPKRPRLENLHTAGAIKEWLPSITREIDINLKQCQAPCYSDSLIGDYQQKVLRLEREFKAFVRKMYDLEPGLGAMPWTDRPYQSKKQQSKATEEQTVAVQPIPTPLLDLLPPCEEEKPTFSNDCDSETMDMPLSFNFASVDCQQDVSKRCEGQSQNFFPNGTPMTDTLGFKGPSIGKVLLGLDYSSSSDSEVS